MRITPHKAQRGFLTIAQNSDINYLELAYVQAMSIKLTMPSSLYAIVVDQDTNQQIASKHRQVFDYIIVLDEDYAKDEQWKLSNEWQLYYLSPFKETIKLESDILITRDIYHWWDAFRLRDVVLSTDCQDYLQNVVKDETYRRVFADNDLPNIYNGLMYFRYSSLAEQFFNTARILFQNWKTIQTEVLIKCNDENPTTDLVYALTSKIVGVENCTLSSLSWINFVHMKSAINKWPNSPWHEMVIYELDLPMIRINNINQYQPFHYHEKTWITESIIQEYEKCLNLK